ncbi:hypothetical protein [Herbaspirillum lusitanum]|uniref:non-homologous end-joining DNA ligase LigD n=1 Tax=Herbaspirillum lusitanum TaxID=213312 RepID=UPI0039BF4A10
MVRRDARRLAVAPAARRQQRGGHADPRSQAGRHGADIYSPRARSGAPVSVPLAWDELDGTTRADSFTVVTVPKRLASLKRDPWHDYVATRQHLTKKILSSFSMEKESA